MIIIMYNFWDFSKWKMGKGVLDVLCKECNKDEKVFSLIKDGERVKRYVGKVNVKNILKILQIPEKNKIENRETKYALYEILHTYPRKLYFDIDSKEKIELEFIKKIILKYFPDEKMAISGSEEDEKYSYHIILPDIIISNNDELVQLRKFVRKLSETECSFFDWRVYSERRLMKCVGFRKNNKRKIQEIIEDNNIKNHIISEFFNNDEKSISLFFVDKVFFSE